MTSTVFFATYRQGSLNIPTSYISKLMYQESVSPQQYDVRDLRAGLSFQLVSSTRALIADPSFPIVKTILDAQWQVIYDSTYTGVDNVKFVAQGSDPTVASNVKSINDVLQLYNYTGALPIVSLSQVFMQVIKLGDNQYVVGTLFTPSQPYINLTYTGTTTSLAANTFTAIPFNTISDTIGLEEADSAQIVPITTGADTGKVQLTVPGRYLIEASFELLLSTVTSASVFPGIIQLRLNGNDISRNFGLIQTYSGNMDGSVSIVAIVRVKKSDLSNATYPNKAVLDVAGNHTFTANALPLKSSTYTNFAITFLG